VKKHIRVGYNDELLREWLDTIFAAIKRNGHRNYNLSDEDKVALQKRLDSLWSQTSLSDETEIEYGIQRFVQLH